jgi:hypothetical protein
MSTSTHRKVRETTVNGHPANILEAYGAVLTPVWAEPDPEATEHDRGRVTGWRRAIYLVRPADRPDSEPTVIQWHKHSPRTGAWLVGPYRFRETAKRLAYRQALADIAAREGRWVDDDLSAAEASLAELD